MSWTRTYQPLEPFLIAALLYCFSPQSAAVQPTFAQSPPGSRDAGRAGASRCAIVSVEPHIALTRQGGGFDQTERVVDFTITVFVTNQCTEPLQLSQGSFVSYQTNFPTLVTDGNQPPECTGQQRNFSGLLPPRQKMPFVFRAQNCLFQTGQMDSPRVTLETGRIVTDTGEHPIPSLTETLP